MPEAKFDQIQAELQAKFTEKNYQAAYELATKYCDQFPEHAQLLNYWRSTMAARLKDKDLALSILWQVVDSGFWYGEALLRQSPSYQILQGDPEFEELVNLNLSLQETDYQNTLHLLTIREEDRCLSADDPCPLLLGLHANASNAQGSIGFWKLPAREGWLVGVPQSTQALWKDAYVWDDLEITTREIQKHYLSISEQYFIDEDQIIIAGHSMGGEAATWLAMTGKIPAGGFIACGPGGPYMDDLSKWEPVLERASGSGLRGFVIFGENDNTIPQDNISEFVKMLNQAEIPCQLEIIPGAGHEYNQLYDSSLSRALRFIGE